MREGQSGVRRGRPRCPYNAGSAGVVGGIGYPTRTCNWGVGFGD